MLPSVPSLREPVRVIKIQKAQVANSHPAVFIILSFRDSLNHVPPVERVTLFQKKGKKINKKISLALNILADS